MLAIPGRLNRKQGGPGVFLPLPSEITSTLKRAKWSVTKDVNEHQRRSVYLFAKRNLRYPLFAAFDRPKATGPCVQRRRSTTPTQSLILINSNFSLDMARSFAGALFSKAGSDRVRQVDTAYRWAMGRLPDEREQKLALQFIKQQATSLKEAKRNAATLAIPDKLPEGTDPIAAAALTDFCLALFNVNEFIYVD